jgi:hypothetical protein
LFVLVFEGNLGRPPQENAPSASGTPADQKQGLSQAPISRLILLLILHSLLSAITDPGFGIADASRCLILSSPFNPVLPTSATFLAILFRQLGLPFTALERLEIRQVCDLLARVLDHRISFIEQEAIQRQMCMAGVQPLHQRCHALAKCRHRRDQICSPADSRCVGGMLTVKQIQKCYQSATKQNVIKRPPAPP